MDPVVSTLLQSLTKTHVLWRPIPPLLEGWPRAGFAHVHLLLRLSFRRALLHPIDLLLGTGVRQKEGVIALDVQRVVCDVLVVILRHEALYQIVPP
eukprot:5057318-Karenia_brevis.AAC.1